MPLHRTAWVLNPAALEYLRRLTLGPDPRLFGADLDGLPPGAGVRHGATIVHADLVQRAETSLDGHGRGAQHSVHKVLL
jgi:hypothetical protein